MGGGSFDLEGKCCVVTGASGGLGFHMANLLAAHGAHVFGISRNQPTDDSKVNHLVADVTDTDEIMRLVADIEERYGPVECWVNNAGASASKPAGELDQGEMSSMLAVNTISPAVLGDRVAMRMKDNDVQGSIINISSTLAGTSFPRAASYSASKAALEYLTRQQARVWARHGIRFNALAPGWIRTAMTQEVFDKGFEAVLRGQIPMRRVGEPSDLDGALLLLASNASRYMTGSVITIDGGFGA